MPLCLLLSQVVWQPRRGHRCLAALSYRLEKHNTEAWERAPIAQHECQGARFWKVRFTLLVLCIGNWHLFACFGSQTARFCLHTYMTNKQARAHTNATTTTHKHRHKHNTCTHRRSNLIDMRLQLQFQSGAMREIASQQQLQHKQLGSQSQQHLLRRLFTYPQQSQQQHPDSNPAPLFAHLPFFGPPAHNATTPSFAQRSAPMGPLARRSAPALGPFTRLSSISPTSSKSQQQVALSVYPSSQTVMSPSNTLASTSAWVYPSSQPVASTENNAMQLCSPQPRRPSVQSKQPANKQDSLPTGQPAIASDRQQQDSLPLLYAHDRLKQMERQLERDSQQLQHNRKQTVSGSQQQVMHAATGPGTADDILMCTSNSQWGNNQPLSSNSLERGNKTAASDQSSPDPDTRDNSVHGGSLMHKPSMAQSTRMLARKESSVIDSTCLTASGSFNRLSGSFSRKNSSTLRNSSSLTRKDSGSGHGRSLYFQALNASSSQAELPPVSAQHTRRWEKCACVCVCCLHVCACVFECKHLQALGSCHM